MPKYCYIEFETTLEVEGQPPRPFMDKILLEFLYWGTSVVWTETQIASETVAFCMERDTGVVRMFKPTEIVFEVEKK